MKEKGYFGKFYARIAKEGWLKAILCGLCVGFAVNFASAFAVWVIHGTNTLWIPIVAGVATAAISVPLFYFLRFRPDEKAVARRMDSLGLDERMITMLELRDDASYIAMRQREDAEKQMRAANANNLRFCVSKVSVALLGVFAVLGLSMTTVAGLSASGKAPNGYDFIDNLLPEKQLGFVSVSYVVEEGGIIEGEADQLIEIGGDAETVVAVADEGWMFVCWQEDESEDPSRTDVGVMEDVIYTAVFQRVEPGENGEGDGEGEGEPSDGEGEPSEGDPSDPGDPSQGSGSGSGPNRDNDQVIDGETNYGDVLGDYVGDANESLANGSIPGDLAGIIEGYYGILG